MVGSLAFVVHSVVLLLIVVNSTSSISFLTEVYISYFYIYIYLIVHRSMHFC